MTTVILQIVSIILAIGLGLMLKYYLPSYFSEKAKNLATKEDLEEITKISEEVRTVYLKQVEVYKASVDIFKSQKEGYLFAQKECLLDFYDLVVEFCHEKLLVSFDDFPVDNGKSISGFFFSCRSLVSAIIKANQRLLLYHSFQEPLVSEAMGICNYVLEADRVMRKFGGRIIFTQLEENVALINTDTTKARIAYDEAFKVRKEYDELMLPIIKKFIDAMLTYQMALNKYLHPEYNAEIPKIIYK